jgi:flagellar hook-associated protein 2
MDLGLSGLASNLDWRTLVDQLSNAERVPQTRLRTDQSTIARQNAAYAAIQTSLESLQTRVQSLNSTALFDTRSTTTSDEKMSSATASAGATIASYAFNVTRLATAAKRVGTSDVGSSLNATNDVSGLLVSAAPFATTVTTGTFTVNGKQITIGASDTMQTVFDNIQAATGSEVAASYDSVADRITLSSANPIVLGSATDTSRAAEWIAKRGRRAAEGGSSVACGASRGERDLGRASERFESERKCCGTSAARG